MFNILVASRAWARYWATHKILIHYHAVVAIMASSKTRDLTIAAKHRNILMECARFDIDLQTIHFPGKSNVIADAFSRLSLDSKYIQVVIDRVPDHVWMDLHVSIMQLNVSI